MKYTTSKTKCHCDSIAGSMESSTVVFPSAGKKSKIFRTCSIYIDLLTINKD